MSERSEKDSENSAISLERMDLIEAGRRVLDMALTRMEGRYTKNPERLRWARVVNGAISSTGSVLKDVDLSDLLARVEALEKKEGKP